jgi:hypothetical protein
MTDRASIEQQKREENPVFIISEGFGDRGTISEYVVSPEEMPELYEEMIQDLVNFAMEDLERQAEEADKRTRGQRIRDRLARLESNMTTLQGTIPAATGQNKVMQQMLLDIHQATVATIEYLIEQRQINDSGGPDGLL